MPSKKYSKVHSFFDKNKLKSGCLKIRTWLSFLDSFQKQRSQYLLSCPSSHSKIDDGWATCVSQLQGMCTHFEGVEERLKLHALANEAGFYSLIGFHKTLVQSIQSGLINTYAILLSQLMKKLLNLLSHLIAAPRDCLPDQLEPLSLSAIASVYQHRYSRFFHLSSQLDLVEIRPTVFEAWHQTTARLSRIKPSLYSLAPICYLSTALGKLDEKMPMEAYSYALIASIFGESDFFSSRLPARLTNLDFSFFMVSILYEFFHRELLGFAFIEYVADASSQLEPVSSLESVQDRFLNAYHVEIVLFVVQSLSIYYKKSSDLKASIQSWGGMWRQCVYAHLMVPLNDRMMSEDGFLQTPSPFSTGLNAVSTIFINNQWDELKNSLSKQLLLRFPLERSRQFWLAFMSSAAESQCFIVCIPWLSQIAKQGPGFYCEFLSLAEKKSAFFFVRSALLFLVSTKARGFLTGCLSEYGADFLQILMRFSTQKVCPMLSFVVFSRFMESMSTRRYFLQLESMGLLGVAPCFAHLQRSALELLRLRFFLSRYQDYLQRMIMHKQRHFWRRFNLASYRQKSQAASTLLQLLPMRECIVSKKTLLSACSSPDFKLMLRVHLVCNALPTCYESGLMGSLFWLVSFSWTRYSQAACRLWGEASHFTDFTHRYDMYKRRFQVALGLRFRRLQMGQNRLSPHLTQLSVNGSID